MNVVDLSAIEAGMVLAEPALNRNGQILLPAGATLEARHLTVFKTWGVTQVAVQSAGPESEGGAARADTISPEILARARGRLSQRWPWPRRNPLEREIYALAFKRACDLSLQGDQE